MKLKLTLTALTLGLSGLSAQAQTEIQWWHSMGGALGEWVNDHAKDFNASQTQYKVVPTFKGSYDESMTAAIAAFRSGNAPHILQVFEVGTATMMASKGAIVPVGKIMADAGVKFDPKNYVQAVAGYYTAPNGSHWRFARDRTSTGGPSPTALGPTSAPPGHSQQGQSGTSSRARRLATQGPHRATTWQMPAPGPCPRDPTAANWPNGLGPHVGAQPKVHHRSLGQGPIKPIG
jgi:hypothetical protein